MTDLSSSEICQPAQAQTLVVIPHFPVYETARFPGIHRTDPSWIGSTRGRSPGSRNDGDLTTEILQPDLRDVDPVHQDLTLAGLEELPLVRYVNYRFFVDCCMVPCRK